MRCEDEGALHVSVPDWGEVQHEAGEQRFTREPRRIVEALHRPARPIHVDLVFDRIDQPTQLSAVGDVLVHLLLHNRECVRGRTQFDDEVGTERLSEYPS